MLYQEKSGCQIGSWSNCLLIVLPLHQMRMVSIFFADTTCNEGWGVNPQIRKLISAKKDLYTFTLICKNLGQNAVFLASQDALEVMCVSQ